MLMFSVFLIFDPLLQRSFAEILCCKDPVETDFVTVGVIIIISRVGGTQQLPPKPLQNKQELKRLQLKASLLVLEKGKPSTDAAAMQGVQKMQQAIVC